MLIEASILLFHIQRYHDMSRIRGSMYTVIALYREGMVSSFGCSAVYESCVVVNFDKTELSVIV